MELTFDQFLQAVDIITGNEPSTDKIQEASNIIYKFKETNTTLFLMYSAQIVLLPEVSDNQATIGITFIKSVLRQTRYYGIDFITQVWFSIPEEQRVQLKQALIRGIMFPKDELRNASSSTLAIIAQLEYPDYWPDFFDILVTLCQDKSYGTSAVMGALQTLNDAFTSSTFIRPRYIKEKEQALKIVCLLSFQVLQQDTPPEMKAEAVLLLHNSFKTTFVRNYKNSHELINTTFQAILANFSILNDQLHSYIYDFFIIAFRKLYEKIFPQPILEIAQAITLDLQSGNIDFQKMALAFITKCAIFEFDLAKELGANVNESFTKTCSRSFTLSIIPFLVFINDNFEFDVSDDSLSYYTYRLLKKFTLFDNEYVPPIVQTYFNEKKADEDWKIRCSSIIALRSILNAGSEVAKFVCSVFPDIINLTQDPNINVRLYSQKFISSFIKKSQISDDPIKEVQFIIEFSTQLLNQDIKQAISGCKIIYNYASRYTENNIQSPLSYSDVLSTLLYSLWDQFNRPEIFNSSLDVHVKKTICALCRQSPFQTLETKKAFCIEVFNRFRANFNNGSNITSDLILFQSTLLEIFGHVIFTIRALLVGENEAFVDDIFQYLSQFLPRMGDIPCLIKTIGNIIITVPTRSAIFADTLVKFLMDAQMSDIVELVTESALTIGDLFRAAPKVMEQYSEPFCNTLLLNIEKDELPNQSVCQQIMTLADIVNNTKSSESIVSLRDRMMAVVRNYTHYKYNQDDPGDIEIMASFLEGVIYLSGAILKTFSYDEPFITNKQNIDILFEFRYLIKPELFTSSTIDFSIILFLAGATENQKAARSYNMYLNHNNIKLYLTKIINKSESEICVEKAKNFKALLNNV